MGNKKGFTLIELLIYISIFSILTISFSAILVTFTRVSVSQLAQNEVSSQLNFVLQRLQNMIAEAGFVVVRDDVGNFVGDNWDEEDNVSSGTAAEYLIIKDKEEGNGVDDFESPIVVYIEGDEIIVRTGRGNGLATTTLTTPKVKAVNLTFTKYANDATRNLIEIDLTLKSADENQSLSRRLLLGVSTAFAAVFNTNLEVKQNATFSGNIIANGDITANSVIVNNTFKVGDGDIIKQIKTGTFIVSSSSIGANRSRNIDYDLQGVLSGDIIIVSPQNLTEGITFQGSVPSANQIRLRLYNASSTDISINNVQWQYIWLGK